ncbi:MAG: hypothetical protein PHY74_01495 [Candidatus Bathyarchaeota archaeon]|nr:hypothetical protein [Candidatus Bathyarchaeota archaeon]MDD4324929.1 hypothetical protein [Candidatus Bathyarchaeota archaeon]
MKSYKNRVNSRGTTMGLSEYFIILQYILMGSTFVALALIFLYTYYGRDEEAKPE